MKRSTVGRWLLGGLALFLAAGFSKPAQAQVVLKLSIQKMTMKMKRKPTPAERRDGKALARNLETKVLDQQKLSLSYGEPTELKLPNGNKLILTALSRDAAAREVKLRVKLQVKDTGTVTEMSIPEGHGVPLTGGIYEGGMLMVNTTASVP